MHCEDVDRLASVMPPRQLAQDAGVLQHLERCARCRVLYGDWSEALPESEVSSEVKGSIVNALLADLKPVRPQPPALQLVATVLLILVGMIAAMAVLLGTEGLRLMTPWQKVVLGAVGLCGAALLSYGLVTLMHPSSQRPRLALAGMAVIVAGFSIAVASLFPWPAPQRFVMGGLRCFGAVLALTAPTMALLYVVMRRGYVLNAPLAGSTAAALAVLCAATVIQMFCPDQTAAHLLMWHGGGVLLAIGAGNLVGRRLQT